MGLDVQATEGPCRLPANARANGDGIHSILSGRAGLMPSGEVGKQPITIWLTPEAEECLQHKELAAVLGIPLQTLRQRLINYGSDHYLTYFPGDIPSKIRRKPNKQRRNGEQSLISTIKVERLSELMHSSLAIEFVVKLITFSQREFKRRGCKESRDFLLNRTGMLKWYIECIPRVDCAWFLKRMKEWVESGGKGPVLNPLKLQNRGLSPIVVDRCVL